MSFSDDGDILYIAMWQCTVAVHVFDTREMELREPITVEGRHEVFPWPGGYDVLARGDDLIVTLDANRQLIVVDRHRREVRRVAALDDDGTRQPMSHIALDGQTLYVSHHGLQRVLVFDLALE